VLLLALKTCLPAWKKCHLAPVKAQKNIHTTQKLTKMVENIRHYTNKAGTRKGARWRGRPTAARYAIATATLLLQASRLHGRRVRVTPRGGHDSKAPRQLLPAKKAVKMKRLFKLLPQAPPAGRKPAFGHGAGPRAEDLTPDGEGWGCGSPSLRARCATPPLGEKGRLLTADSCRDVYGVAV